MPGSIRFCCALCVVMGCNPLPSALQHRRSDGLEPVALIVDAEGNGIRLQGVATGPLVKDPLGRQMRTGWTTPNSDDAFVVVEQNQNGRIDSLTELLGWQGPPNGFDYLRALDGTPPGPGKFGRAHRSPDQTIDASDAIFHRLVLWQDANADGESSEQELKSATFLGFRSISLKTEAADQLISGNRVVERAQARREQDGKVSLVEVVGVRLGAK